MGPLIDASATSQEYEKNISVTLKRLRHSHLNNRFLPKYSIPLGKSFGDLDKIVYGNIYILCIAETKLDESFPKIQFVYQYNQSI